MLETVLNYIIQYGPAVLAIICEAGVVKYAISILGKAMKSKEFKALAESNKELAESNKALAQKVDEQTEKINKLMDKIGRIHNDGQQINKKV